MRTCYPDTSLRRYRGTAGVVKGIEESRSTGSASRGCGVHIHVGLKSEAGDHTAQTLTNLANIMTAHEEQIGRAIKIDAGRTARYCRTVDPDFLNRVNTGKPQTIRQLAKELNYARSKPQQRENEKYAFRCWMLRLGFIGTESKTARKLLLQNVSGDGA